MFLEIYSYYAKFSRWPYQNKFMTLVIKIALNLWESKIASCIIADFNSNMTEAMVERALKTDQMDFIYTVWSYRK